MGIVTPIALPVAWSLTGDHTMIAAMVGVVFSGAIFGDHTSPISDTTVLSATFTGADLVDHVRTQLYYAVTVAAVAVLLLLVWGFLGVTPFVLLPVGVVLLVALVYRLSELDARRKGVDPVAVHATKERPDAEPRSDDKGRERHAFLLRSAPPPVFDAATLAVYLAAAVALILSPGPDTAYVLARGAGEGRRAGVLSALGVASGILVHTVAAALGLAALFETFPRSRTVVTALGACYLAYLGVRSLRAAEADAHDADGNPYVQGLTVNVLNPQVALFFLAFLPGFAPDAAPALGMLVLGALYALITALYLGCVGLLSGTVGGRGPWLQRAPGVALLGLAGWLLVRTLPV